MTMSTNHHPPHGSSNNRDASSVASTIFSASTGHDSRIPSDDERTISVRPGAIRVDREGAGRALLLKGKLDEESEEEDVSCAVSNNGSSSHVVRPARPEDQPSAVAAPIQQAPHTEQHGVVYAELVPRQDPIELIIAVRAPGSGENTGGGWENSEESNSKVCGIPQSWIKLVLLIDTMMLLVGVLVVVVVYFLVQKAPTNSSITVPMSPTNSSITVPMSVIFNLLVEYIPDLSVPFSRLESAEYRAMDWLTLDNGNIFSKDDNGTFVVEKIELLVQRYVMAVFYYEKGFDTKSSRDWLSSNFTCYWSGMECDDWLRASATSCPQWTIQCGFARRMTILSLSLSDDEAILSGTIPTVLGLLSTLNHLDLGSNQLSGSLPTEIGLLTKLFYLGLRENQLSGSLPTEIELLTGLTTLTLVGNDNLWGNVNPLFCNSSNTSVTTMNPYFSNNSCLEMPDNVTCDCCYDRCFRKRGRRVNY